MLFLTGLPLFLMELSLGQYGATGPITVWKCCPILRGRAGAGGSSPCAPAAPGQVPAEAAPLTPLPWCRRWRGDADRVLPGVPLLQRHHRLGLLLPGLVLPEPPALVLRCPPERGALPGRCPQAGAAGPDAAGHPGGLPGAKLCLQQERRGPVVGLGLGPGREDDGDGDLAVLQNASGSTTHTSASEAFWK